MLAPLVLLLISASVWLFAAPGERFLRGLRRLLVEPVVHRGLLGFLAGCAEVRGTFGTRNVRVVLQLKRGRHGLGFLELAMATTEPQRLGAADLDVRVRDDAGRSARASLAARGLSVLCEDGWVHARWAPVGFGMFPGPFQEAVWNQVLVDMGALAAAIER